jgi:peptidoglycan hydrolase-like protein with peptidoglycan-binding domain
MTSFQMGAIALYSVLLMVAALPATARDDALISARMGQAWTTVDQMPPLMRAAYLKGIRDELVAHGYDPGPDETLFDDRFRTAIQRYQIDSGLRPDGIASKELLEHLLFALPKVFANGSRSHPAHGAAPRYGRIALASPARKSAASDDEPVPAPAPRGRVQAKLLSFPGESAHGAFPRPDSVPGIGATASYSGGIVSQTQRALRARGYYRGPIDGQFSDELADAIRAFQKNNRLRVSGVIDGQLLAALS